MQAWLPDLDNYPVAPTSETLDVIHGETVADPFRPLEDSALPGTAEWIHAQAELAERAIMAIPSLSDIRSTVERLVDHPRAGVPVERGGRWFRMRNAGMEAQDALWVADEPTSMGRRVIDPAEWSDEGLTATSATAISPDGLLVAYARSESGSDWQTWRVRSVDSGVDLEDQIEWSKFSGAEWSADSSGFFYTAASAPDAGKELTAPTGTMSVKLHRIGSDASLDEVVFAAPEHPEWIPDAWVSDDGRHLVVTVQSGTDERTALWHRRLDDPTSELEPLNSAFTAAERVVGAEGDELYVRSDRFDARGEILVAYPRNRPEPPAATLPSPAATPPVALLSAATPPAALLSAATPPAALPSGARDPWLWRKVVAASQDTLLDAAVLGGHLVCHYLHQACSTLKVFDLDGRPIRDIPLPALSSVSSGPSGHHSSPTVLFGVESFVESGALWSHDLDSGETKVVEKSNADFDSLRFVTQQVFVESSPSVLIPMFLVRAKDATASSDNPVLLYGYGGFAVPITPSFSTAFAAWLERGGVVAVANLRGGGEFGKEWHDAGRLGAKQNVFDDLCACARWLAASGWSAPSKIAVNGASNGGLTVGACITQHPELFGAAVAEVGVLDMLRFHLFTIGWAWKADYGDPDVAEQFEWLRAYSPLHNLRRGACYPPTLISTADHDDRVVPAHSYKFTAAMQQAQGCSNPVLLRVTPSAGHGAGKPTQRVIDDVTAKLAFIEAALSHTSH